MYLIDTHCHISHLKRGQKAVIDRAFRAGVKKFVNVACQMNELQPSLDLAKRYDCIWSTAGIHPTMLTDDMEKGLAAVRGLAAGEERVVAIGEIGLDYYHDKFPHDRQEAFFAAQLGIAKELGLPAIIHLRSSKNAGENEAVFVDALRILERENFSHGVAHCFSGNMIEAEKMLDLGLMFSFTGIITYQNNESLREVVKMVPLDRIMLETDSPYLTVESRKGQTGEPADVKVIAETVAQVKNVPFEEVARMTTENAERFFGI
ncbi:TatD family hydrolase [Patescibacteria group bacterium]|nr:TatD family hydrolase [Patescibacteria group bacterium]MBU1015512.1 TatD family hydrolase [Patescibacteria group bacterium]MBU1685435.1 TatD family hydrolase [Patescibacteria group bacterium]MBU1938396.1 TatD family hydrolase [Patescibacteria group bacterium]